MAGDGLWQGGPGASVPLALAAQCLAERLQHLDAPEAHAAVLDGGWRLIRVEVPVSAVGPPTALLLRWLEAQAGMTPRCFFAARGNELLIAGVGAAHMHRDGDCGPGQLVPRPRARPGGADQPSQTTKGSSPNLAGVGLVELGLSRKWWARNLAELGLGRK